MLFAVVETYVYLSEVFWSKLSVLLELYAVEVLLSVVVVAEESEVFAGADVVELLLSVVVVVDASEDLAGADVTEL